MDNISESQFRRQINVRLDPQAVRELRALRTETGEEYSPLIRRLIHQEAERTGVLGKLDGPASGEEEGRGG